MEPWYGSQNAGRPTAEGFPMQNSTLAKLALTAAVVTAGSVIFAKSIFGHTTDYKMVDELGDTSQWSGKKLKVHGWVVSGSIKSEVIDQETHRSFVLWKGSKKLRVYISGPVPDTFKDESEVVASGRMVPAAEMTKIAQALHVPEAEYPYVVLASELSAKCPSKYEGANANKDLKAADYKATDYK